MGTYIDRADLLDVMTEALLVQTTDDGGVGVADEPTIAAAIAGAEAEIDAYLQSHGYAVPLSPAPPIVQDLARTLTKYRLYGRRDLTDEALEARHKGALRLLEKLATGALDLGAAPPPQTATTDLPEAATDDADRTWTRDTLQGFSGW